MITPTVERLTAALATVHDPEIKRPITELGMVDRLEIDDGGRVTSARMFGGVTAWPVERMTAFVAGRDEVRLGDLA